MSPSVELPELDPFVEDFQQFPFATLALLRERAPVHAMAEPGWYIVTTIELAREVLTDPARFSNQVSRRTSPPAEVADEVAAIRSEGFGYVPTLLLNAGDGRSPATTCSACSSPPLATQVLARSPSGSPSSSA